MTERASYNHQSFIKKISTTKMLLRYSLIFILFFVMTYCASGNFLWAGLWGALVCIIPFLIIRIRFDFDKPWITINHNGLFLQSFGFIPWDQVVEIRIKRYLLNPWAYNLEALTQWPESTVPGAKALLPLLPYRVVPIAQSGFHGLNCSLEDITHALKKHAPPHVKLSL